MSSILNAALLKLIEDSATAAAILIEGLTQGELLRLRLTRAEVLRQLQALAASAAQVPSAVRSEMPELDWAGWDAMRPRFDAAPGDALDEALWFACTSLVPATLLWLRVYRQGQPALFQMSVA